MLAAVLHGMQGTPYIYQGEELGMTNVKFKDITDYRDVETTNMYYERLAAGYDPADVMRSIYAKSRDNARTPMQWSSEKNAGFTTGAPWIAVNPNYVKINAESEKNDPDSVYNFYKELVHLRKEYPVFADGDFSLIMPEDEQIFAYIRSDEKSRMLVCANFTGELVKYSLPEEWKNAQMLIHNYPGEQLSEELKPYEAVILFKEDEKEERELTSRTFSA